MELLIPEGADVLASYDHYNWKEYAAITQNKYGKGKAVYFGCLTDKDVVEKILYDVLKEVGVELPEEKFSVIVRKGKNDFGKQIRYYFNYSAEEQTVKSYFSDGVDLLGGNEIMEQDTIYIEPWGVKIIEEK